MAVSKVSSFLPNYREFVDSVAILGLPISGSELHGLLCGYLCAGAASEGERYIRALMVNQNDAAQRAAILAVFHLFATSQQQLTSQDFAFQLLLPEDDLSLTTRAQAFSEWCGGFIQGISTVGVGLDGLEDDEASDAMQHLQDFALLDCESLTVDEEDERALVEVSEYARLAVLHIFHELQKKSMGHRCDESVH